MSSTETMKRAQANISPWPNDGIKPGGSGFQRAVPSGSGSSPTGGISPEGNGGAPAVQAGIDGLSI